MRTDDAGSGPFSTAPHVLGSTNPARSDNGERLTSVRHQRSSASHREGSKFQDTQPPSYPNPPANIDAEQDPTIIRQSSRQLLFRIDGAVPMNEPMTDTTIDENDLVPTRRA